jgi:hypothetical protein
MSRRHRSARYCLAALAVMMATGAMAGCDGSAKPAQTSASSHGKAPAVPARLDPAKFGPPATGRNKWLPLKPGIQWVRDGGTNVGHRRVHHQVISTVTDVSRLIQGIHTVAVLDQDIDGGQLAQQSIDYFATDKQGNVWDMGSYTAEYDGGRFSHHNDSWLSGVLGAKAGIQMPADPKPSDPPYSIAQPQGDDPDVAKVIEAGTKLCVPFRCFKNVLVIREGKAAAPDNAFKYYAAGIGELLDTPKKDSTHRDYEQLVNLRQLDAHGLVEFSRIALALDRRAVSDTPKVFGGGPGASRGV